MGLDPNRIPQRLDPVPQQWLLEKKIDLYMKNLPQKQFSRHSLVRRPYWQKFFKTLPVYS